MPAMRAHCSDLPLREHISWKAPAVFLLWNHYRVQAKATFPQRAEAVPASDCAQQQCRGRSFCPDVGFLQWSTLAQDSPQSGWRFLGTTLHSESVPSPLLPRVSDLIEV